MGLGEFQNKVIVVTGSAGGIGSALVSRLAEEQAQLALSDFRKDALEAQAKLLAERGIQVLAVAADVSQADEMMELAARTEAAFGGVDALVNNAGLDSPRGNAWDIDDAAWRETIDIDLSGQWWCTKAFLPMMMRQQRGKVVFVSSVAAKLGGIGFSPAYAAAKAGLLGLTTSLSLQLESHGILVNAVLPGTVGTTGTMLNDVEKAKYLGMYPLGFGGTKPVVDAITYLLGSSGDWLSGVHLNVSGGRLRGP